MYTSYQILKRYNDFCSRTAQQLYCQIKRNQVILTQNFCQKNGAGLKAN